MSALPAVTLNSPAVFSRVVECRVGTKGPNEFNALRNARGYSPPLGRDFFNQSTLRVARALICKFIVRSHRGRRLAAMITEAEAYRGPADRASHAYGGRRTRRVEPLYRDGGTAYVY